MTRIPLRARDGRVRAYAIVDSADYERVARYRWCLHSKDSYAARTDRTGPRQRTVLLHRELMGLEPADPLEVDHKNGNGLDCRRRNLRLVTHMQNSQNQHVARGRSRHRGVSWNLRAQAWAVRVTVNGQRVFGGYFADEDEAGRRAAEMRRELLTHSIECEAA